MKSHTWWHSNLPSTSVETCFTSQPYGGNLNVRNGRKQTLLVQRTNLGKTNMADGWSRHGVVDYAGTFPPCDRAPVAINLVFTPLP